MRSAALDLVPPTWQSMPEFAVTLGPEVGELCTVAGFTPDPEQQAALDMLFALGANGKAAVRDMAVVAPRQNLKTGFLKQACLGWLYITEQRLVVWSAHEFGTSQEAFRDMTELIEGCPDLDREVKQIHRGNGDEAIELVGDRRLKFKARTKSGGRGLTGDKVVLDEAMYLRPSHMGSLIPTLRAVPDPQVVLAGSAGMANSDVWRSYRDAGRAGSDPTLGYVEYGDPSPRDCRSPECDHAYGNDGCSLDDRDRWWRLNTALKNGRITEETLASDRRRLPADEFARETLGWWDEPLITEAGVFGERWLELIDVDAERGSPVAFGVAVAPDRSWSAIAVAWKRADGHHQVQVTDYRPSTEWVEFRAVELRRQWGGAVHASTAAKGLVPGAVEPSKADQARAHTGLDDAVTAGTVHHGNQPSLNVAVRGARWKPYGDTRMFDRKSSTDITPLDAAALALHALRSGTDQGGWVMAL